MNPIKILNAEELELLRKVDTPTVCNVIELFDIRSYTAGYMDARIQSCFPEMPPMVGYAATATLRTAAPARNAGTYGGLDQQIARFNDIPDPRIVVFQDLDSPPVGATFGEGMCGIYQSFGCVGLVTNGTGRDLQQVRAMNFPIFTTGTICSHGYIQVLDSNIPVHVGGITIYPGDLLHGDCNGVTTIPLEIASEVARLCAPFMEAEGHIFAFVKGGSRDAKQLTEARLACSQQIQELRVQAKAFIATLGKP